MSDSINPLSMISTAPLATTKSSKASSWLEAMASAWGETLDRKASDIEATAAEMSAGNNQPSVITKLSTQAMEMGFLANSSHNAISSSGEALKAMAQK